MDFPESWDSFIRVMTPVISESCQRVINTVSNEIPTYYCRYEDLRTDPVPLLNEIFRFILDVPSIDGTVVEKRIKDVAAEGSESKAIYKLKTTSTDMNRNAFMYSEEQMDFLKQELKDTLYYFGYTNNSTYWFQHETSFFEYKV